MDKLHEFMYYTQLFAPRVEQLPRKNIMSQGDGFRKGVGIAFRLGTELIVAPFLGSAMGYALDYQLGSDPWFLIFGVFMGGAAGCLNAYRAFQEVVKDNGKDNE